MLSWGLPQGPWDVAALARELLALEQVRDESPELQGDRVAGGERWMLAFPICRGVSRAS